MSTSVFFVVLVAAALHASWNFLVKSNTDQHLAMTAVVLGHAPFGVLAILAAPAPDPAAWPYLAAGVVLHVGYQFFLLSAYRLGDLSQVYPTARGVAPLIVAAVSVTWLGTALSRWEWLGVVAIAIGIMSLSLVRRADGLRNHRAAFAALATGCFIAGYSLVDGLGARAAGTALGFYGWLTVCNAVLFAPLMALLRPGTLTRLGAGGGRLLVLGGGASFLAYALVVWSFTQAPIALVAALRETSMLFALLLGVWVLRERLDLRKLFATFTTLLGVAALRLGH